MMKKYVIPNGPLAMFLIGLVMVAASGAWLVVDYAHSRVECKAACAPHAVLDCKTGMAACADSAGNVIWKARP